MAMPQTEFTADFHCVTTWSKLDVTWTGVRVTDFLREVDLDPAAVHVMQHCYGGYTTNIALDDLMRDENFFAHTLVGEPLPADHGGPLRLVVPHLYAWKSAKWINGLEFLDQPALGFWERNGYHHRGDPWAVQRYSDRP
jgi:DMSO/TMAO reductase YedYZ molybdopterin-dependent catalytic subunit